MDSTCQYKTELTNFGVILNYKAEAFSRILIFFCVVMHKVQTNLPQGILRQTSFTFRKKEDKLFSSINIFPVVSWYRDEM